MKILGRKCPNCRRDRPEQEYQSRNGKAAGWCRTCVKAGMARYRETQEYRDWMTRYNRRPEVRDRKALDYARRAAEPGAREKRKARRNTTRARVVSSRGQARRRLAAATDPKRRAALETLIAAYDRELARMDPAARPGDEDTDAA